MNLLSNKSPLDKRDPNLHTGARFTAVSARFLWLTLKAELLCQAKEKRSKAIQALRKSLGLAKGKVRQMVKSCPKIFQCK